MTTIGIVLLILVGIIVAGAFLSHRQKLLAAELKADIAGLIEEIKKLKK